jgi:hypothetical protein
LYTKLCRGRRVEKMSAEGLDYKVILADLEAKRAALDQAIAAIKVLVGEGGQLGVGVPNGIGAGIEPGTFFGLNIAEATKKYLTLAGKAQSTKQVSDALRRGSLDVKDESVAAILQRVVRQGDAELVSVSRGMWGLKRFYPK